MCASSCVILELGRKKETVLLLIVSAQVISALQCHNVALIIPSRRVRDQLSIIGKVKLEFAMQADLVSCFPDRP